MGALLDSSWDILSLLDGEGRLIYNSPAAQRLHGFDAADMDGHSTFEFIHPEDAPAVGEAFQDCMARPENPVRVQYRYARKDGSWIWMEAVAVEVAAPQPGDIAIFRFGRCFSHGGIVLSGGRIVHAMMQHGVCSVSDLHEAFLSKERPDGKTRLKWADRPRKFFDVFAGIRRWAEAH